ncbi:hypothetical protein H5410_058916 [Solanum commersonii]|uniref:Uncharacterized protein n=1 Tax=Solanum commersonii TaxID=4109 RepID=A0A9J5W1W3_SOLCO|nr:hypothetical protein H5410_058916 [Solanum commersonii]
MEPIGPEGPTNPFSSSWSRRANGPIYKFKRNPKEEQPYLTNFHNFVSQNISWTSIMTLLMPLVGPKGKTDTFSSSNETQRRNNKILPIFMCYSPWTFGDLEFSNFFG